MRGAVGHLWRVVIVVVVKQRLLLSKECAYAPVAGSGPVKCAWWCGGKRVVMIMVAHQRPLMVKERACAPAVGGGAMEFAVLGSAW